MPKIFPTSIGGAASTAMKIGGGVSGVIVGYVVEDVIDNHLKAIPRLLTPGEIAMVTSIFKDSINLALVKVRNGPILPFQDRKDHEYAVTPMGEIYFTSNSYTNDFSIKAIPSKHLFMHEMVHVWQFQMGLAVAFWRLENGFVDYQYDLTNDKILSDYRMEQQASIIADYWCLKTFDYNAWYTLTNEKYKGRLARNQQGMRNYWLKIYENTLRLFLKNPKDKKALFG